MVICVEQGADLHMARLLPLSLSVSCFSKIQTGFTFLVAAHLGSPGQRAVKCVCACACVRACVRACVCVLCLCSMLFSKVMRAVKLCSNKILQFLTGGAA